MRKILCLLVIIGGCATPYRPISTGGGSYYQKIQENVYRVGFRGNVAISFNQAYEYSLLRAAEIGRQLGYSHFVVESQEDKSKREYIDYETSVRKPRIEIVAHYYEGIPTGRHLEIHEAEKVIQELSSKYNLKIK